MEHLEHLNETWEKLFKLLKERGVLIVAVPNPSSYDAEKYKEWWAAYDVPRHLWHFTPSVMQQFGVKHGFKLAEQHPMPFDAFYVSMLTERYKGSRLSFLKGMWTGLLAWFSSLAKKERSSSMILCIQKEVIMEKNQGPFFDMQFITSSISTMLVLLCWGWWYSLCCLPIAYLSMYAIRSVSPYSSAMI